MIKNLNQLKRTLKENMLLEITGHCREECVGETVTSPSDRINPGKNPVLWWSKASFWQFQNGNCSVYTSDQHHTEQHLIMSFRVLNEKEAA